MFEKKSKMACGFEGTVVCQLTLASGDSGVTCHRKETEVSPSESTALELQTRWS